MEIAETRQASRSPLHPKDLEDQPAQHRNNFGFLRLLFALLVILSHSFELIDGNRNREPLSRIFGTVSFGEFSVFGFFIVSGYLITKSFLQSSSSRSYVLKRVARIYPGFLCAYVICIFIVGPLAGGDLHALIGVDGLTILTRPLLLLAPLLPGTFEGLPSPQLNSSMWTIAYEFRCYALVLIFGLLGVFRHRLIVGLAAAFLLVLWAGNVQYRVPPIVAVFTGQISEDIRLIGAFCCGSIFFLFQDRIRLSGWGAALSLVALLPLLFVWTLAGPALVVFGGYLLFWFAFQVKSLPLSRVGAKTDVSYGVYLYAWPVQNLLIWYFPGLSPWMVFLFSTIIALGMGRLSWELIESPALRLRSSA